MQVLSAREIKLGGVGTGWIPIVTQPCQSLLQVMPEFIRKPANALAIRYKPQALDVQGLASLFLSVFLYSFSSMKH